MKKLRCWLIKGRTLGLQKLQVVLWLVLPCRHTVSWQFGVRVFLLCTYAKLDGPLLGL